MKNKVAVGIIAFLMSGATLAANDGKISRLLFSGSNSVWGESHSDVVQLVIEGGYNASDCNSSYAAIRKRDEHLISAALSAFTAGNRVTVKLSSADTYYNDRCVISDLFINK